MGQGFPDGRYGQGNCSFGTESWDAYWSCGSPRIRQLQHTESPSSCSGDWLSALPCHSTRRRLWVFLLTLDFGKFPISSHNLADGSCRKDALRPVPRRLGYPSEFLMTQLETIGAILMVLVFVGLGVVGLIIASQSRNGGRNRHNAD